MHPINFSNNSSIAERFIRYAKIFTTSDPDSTSQPSTERQKDLGRLLVNELKALGLTDAEMVKEGYVYATIPANTSKKAPVVCLCAHMDTSPDVSGESVNPILHKNYNGQPITLLNDPNQILTIEQHPYLKEKIGKDIITASGDTLLGADDKAGVAVIMHTVEYLMKNPQIKHGTIKILFTPDEEIGRGVDAVDMERLGADIGYTLDGGACPSLESENFSADTVAINFFGISAHPGYAKDKMVNAIKIAGDFISSLPKDSWSPETTSGREGFAHPVDVRGGAEQATVTFIIRDFDTDMLVKHETRLKSYAQKTIDKYKGCSFEFTVKEQYRNMKEVLDKNPLALELAEKAYQEAGLTPNKQAIRGGTDGARLSFMGMPCPNIFTGAMAIHSRQEFVCVQDMEKASEVCIRLVRLAAK